MAHGFSATINGMVADRYAEVFCNAGFAVLLYDPQLWPWFKDGLEPDPLGN